MFLVYESIAALYSPEYLFSPPDLDWEKAVESHWAISDVLDYGYWGEPQMVWVFNPLPVIDGFVVRIIEGPVQPSDIGFNILLSEPSHTVIFRQLY